MAYRDQPLGELALSIPRASALFRQYDMDYCCGGKQTLARAAARHDVDIDIIEAQLAQLAEQPIEKDWRAFRWRTLLTISLCAIMTDTANNCRSLSCRQPKWNAFTRISQTSHAA